MKHLDCTLEEIIHELASSDETLEYIQTQHLDVYNTKNLDNRKRYLRTYSEVQLRNMFDDIVQTGAKKLKQSMKGQSFRKNI